jgi:hypothetical protein
MIVFGLLVTGGLRRPATLRRPCRDWNYRAMGFGPYYRQLQLLPGKNLIRRRRFTSW